MAGKPKTVVPVQKKDAEKPSPTKRPCAFSSAEIMEEMANDISRGFNTAQDPNGLETSGNKWMRVPDDQDLSPAERDEQKVQQKLLGRGPKKPLRVPPRKE